MGVSPCSNCKDWELSVLLPLTAAALVAHGWCVWRLTQLLFLPADIQKLSHHSAHG